MYKMTKTALQPGKKFLKRFQSCFYKKFVFQTFILVYWSSFKVRRKMPYLGFFRKMKNLWSYLQSPPSNFSKRKFLSKNRNSLYLGLTCLVWVFLGNNFKKTVVIFEITTLEIFRFQSFILRKKTLQFGS